MPHVPNLRSPYIKVGRFVYFGRMLDKIRLHAAGKLPESYVTFLGDSQFYTLDGRCCRFLGLPYKDLRERTLAGGTDEEVLDWAHVNGISRTDEECHMWNRFILKLGWNDPASRRLQRAKADNGLAHRDDIQTMPDFFDVDEGRKP